MRANAVTIQNKGLETCYNVPSNMTGKQLARLKAKNAQAIQALKDSPAGSVLVVEVPDSEAATPSIEEPF